MSMSLSVSASAERSLGVDSSTFASSEWPITFSFRASSSAFDISSFITNNSSHLSSSLSSHHFAFTSGIGARWTLSARLSDSLAGMKAHASSEVKTSIGAMSLTRLSMMW